MLDNFTELKNLEGLREGSLLKVIEGMPLSVSEGIRSRASRHP